MARIALVGAGRMGVPVAACLLRAGHAVGYLAHPGNADAAGIDAAGAERFEGLGALLEGREVLLTVVTGAPEARDVVEAALPHLGGAAVIDCSTSLPATSLDLAGRVAAAGGAWMDCAMTRTPREAAKGRLGLLVGAAPEVFARWRPLLDAFGESVVHVGGPGEGHAAKLVHNFVSLGFSAVLAEAVLAADAAGIDRDVLVEVLAAGGGRGAVLERFAPWLTAGDAAGFDFTLANAAKDADYFARAFASAGPGLLRTAVSVTYEGAADRRPGDPVPSLAPAGPAARPPSGWRG